MTARIIWMLLLTCAFVGSAMWLAGEDEYASKLAYVVAGICFIGAIVFAVVDDE